MGDKVYADHETLVLEGGEIDLHKLRKKCRKNPGHTKFIPVDTFNINHLPEGHRDNDLFEVIKITADLTVRVQVEMISEHRPEYWPDTKHPYPLYNMRNKPALRMGSGMIGTVYKFQTGQYDISGFFKIDKKCWCSKCQNSDTPSELFWEFNVFTATHVVFDDIEASHTKLRLFYDTDTSPEFYVDQISFVGADIEKDWCKLLCVTCDENLVNNLNAMNEKFTGLWKKVFDKYKNIRDVDKLSVIVSHPHGCAKQITIGNWIERNDDIPSYKYFRYTTSTCPGSSGAKVLCPGYEGVLGYTSVTGWGHQIVHRGSIDSKINFSATGLHM